jgi:hypothetical protein
MKLIIEDEIETTSYKNVDDSKLYVAVKNDMIFLLVHYGEVYFWNNLSFSFQNLGGFNTLQKALESVLINKHRVYEFNSLGDILENIHKIL